jgi:alkanesulfonate monooxygenase SsuD/methylene tetrahydromethanopterin reductase-like flavin-dependent oxidoreductase (luciferase family)
MEYGAHLPLIDFGTPPSLRGLAAYAEAAAGSGYGYLCANDHLHFARPWLDGPTALAAVIDRSRDMTLATTVALPVIRGPVPLAKTLAALDVLSEGRLLAGVGPGSSARDYAAAGVPFEERWRRFDDALPALRALLQGGDLEPRPVQRPGPPIWIASWGSPAGLRRVARHGDGWIASAYNITPERFRQARARLGGMPTALATAWLHVTEDAGAADRILSDVLAPMLGRDADELRALALPVGPAELCAARMSAFAEAGVERVFLWPVGDEVRQLELFAERVAPLVDRSPRRGGSA